jgi:site-specific DNA recombinase
MKAIIYGAKSSPDERGSIDDQIRECREYAERQGWEVEAEYQDENKSAYHSNRGPGLAAAKDAAKLAAQGEEVTLLVFSSDRLARGDGKDADHLVELLLEARRSGYRLAAATGENISDLVYAALLGERNHMDSKAKGEHTRAGIRRRAERGNFHGGRVPYGYRYERNRNDPTDPGRLLIDSAQAKAILQMADWYEAGAGFDQISVRLNKAGIPSPTGILWERSSVSNVLGSPVIAGFVHCKGDRFKGEHQPIIDLARWERLQEIRESRRGKGSRPLGHHIFSGGVLRCPECRSALRARTTPAGYAYYCCSHRPPTVCGQSNIEARIVEGLILDGLLALVFDPDETRARIEAAATEERERATSLIAAAEKRVRAVERKRERVMREYVGNVAPDILTQALATLDEEEAQAKAHAAELEEAAQAAEAEAQNFDAEREVVARLERLQEIAAGERDPGTVEILRQAISTTFERIYLLEDPDGKLMVTPVLRREAVAALGGRVKYETAKHGSLDYQAEIPARMPIPAGLTGGNRGK